MSKARFVHVATAARLSSSGWKVMTKGVLRIGIILGVYCLLFPPRLFNADGPRINGVPHEVLFSLTMIAIGLCMTLIGLLATGCRRLSSTQRRATVTAGDRP